MALNSSKNARSIDKSIHTSDFASHTSTTHSREHIDKHAALRAARDYGLRASQRNRAPKQHRASNSGTQRRTSGSAPRAIKEESCIQKESISEEKHRRNWGTPQQRGCISTEQLVRKERHSRQTAMSRVLNWVQESSKLAIADGTLHAHPTDSSEREETSTKDLERESSDRWKSTTNLRHHKPIMIAGMQAESSDKQNSERSSRKVPISKKDTLTAVPKKEGAYRNKSREFKEEVDEEDEGSVEDNADAILVKKRLKELKDAKSSLLAERRVLRLRIEEVQLRREVRQLARDVAKARAELASIALREHREIQNASIEDLLITREAPIHNSQDTAEQKFTNIDSVPRTKHSQIDSDNVALFQRQNSEHKNHQPNLKGTSDQEGVTPKSGNDVCIDQGECSLDLDQEEEEVTSSKVDSVIVKESPTLIAKNLTIETGTVATKCDLRTDADTESARCQTIDNNQAENNTPPVTKLSPSSQEQGSSDHSRNCDEQFLVLESVSSDLEDVKIVTPTLNNASEIKDKSKEDNSNKIIPESIEKIPICTIHDLEAYVFKNKGLKSAPAGLLEFLQENDYDSFAKASSCDGVEMLSAGEEQGDIELKETFCEVVKRLAGGRLDLHKAESHKEDNEEFLASRTSSTFSASSEYEVNISMLPNEAPDAPTSSGTSISSEEEEDDFVELEDEQLVECNIEEANELEEQTGRARDQRPEVFLPLEPFLGKMFQEEPQLKSPEAIDRQREPLAVFITSPRNTRSSPRSPGRLSMTELDKKRGQGASESAKSGPSDTIGSRPSLSVQEALITASSSSSCWVQFSQTDATYIEALVTRFIHAFADPVLPEYLHVDELPLPLTEFCRIEKELGTSYVQEAFDRAVFDSVNQRLMDIYRCCGRVKNEECPSLAEELWKLPSIAYLMEDLRKTVLKTTDCNADPFAAATCKDHLINSLLQQDAKRFGKTFPF